MEAADQHARDLLPLLAFNPSRGRHHDRGRHALAQWTQNPDGSGLALACVQCRQFARACAEIRSRFLNERRSRRSAAHDRICRVRPIFWRVRAEARSGCLLQAGNWASHSSGGPMGRCRVVSATLGQHATLILRGKAARHEG